MKNNSKSLFIQAITTEVQTETLQDVIISPFFYLRICLKKECEMNYYYESNMVKRLNISISNSKRKTEKFIRK